VRIDQTNVDRVGPGLGERHIEPAVPLERYRGLHDSVDRHVDRRAGRYVVRKLERRHTGDVDALGQDSVAGIQSLRRGGEPFERGLRRTVLPEKAALSESGVPIAEDEPYEHPNSRILRPELERVVCVSSLQDGIDPGRVGRGCLVRVLRDPERRGVTTEPFVEAPKRPRLAMPTRGQRTGRSGATRGRGGYGCCAQASKRTVGFSSERRRAKRAGEWLSCTTSFVGTSWPRGDVSPIATDASGLPRFTPS
jgi:hypothetical protein